MSKASVILLILGCLQLVVGGVLVAANTGPFVLSLGLGACIGIGLVISGMITLVAGLAIGIFVWKVRKEGALGAILNIAVLSFLVLLIAAGVVVKMVQSRDSEKEMKKFEAEQSDQRHQEAVASYRDYHQHLWDHKIVLLEARIISKELGCLTVGGYQVITIPTIDPSVDPVDALLLDNSEAKVLLLIKELLNAGAQDDLASLQAFARANGAAVYVHLPSGFTDIMQEKIKLMAIKDSVLAAIKEK